MSVVATNAYSTATGNGATTSFPYTFPARNAADVSVYVNGALQTVGITVTPNVGSNGGTVLFTTPPANAVAIIMQLVPSLQQSAQFINAGAYNPSAVDGANDQAAIRDIYLKGLIDRAALVPLGEIMGAIPAKASRIGKFFGFDAAGNPAPLSGTGNDAALRTDLAGATGASLVAVQGHAPAIIRSVQQILDEGLSLRKDFGALGDGTDQTAKVQSALNAVIATGGAELFAPPGDYHITDKLLFDISAVGDRFASRLRLRGAGSAFTHFHLEGIAKTLLELLGNPAVSETRLDISGIRLSGDNTIGSRGIHLNVAAYGALRDLTIEAFDQQIEFDNVEQLALYDCVIRWGRKGLKTNTGSSTAANSILVFNTVFGNHVLNAMDLSDLNAFTMIGGGVLNNGAVGGDATNFGCKLNNPGTALGTVKFGGVVFEGNGGQADFWVVSTTATASISVEACPFSRASSLAYATNNIRLDGTQPTILELSKSVFRGFNDYVPNAGRPNLAINNAAAFVHSDGTNVFGSATEAPSWYATPYPVMLNAGLTFIGGGLTGTATYDPPSLAAGAKDTIHTMTVTGAALGDKVQASFSIDLAGARMVAWVSATNTVSYYAINENGANPLDLASGTLSVKVIKS